MKKSGSIQDSLSSCIAEAASIDYLLPLLLRRVAESRNISLSDLEIACLAAGIRDAKDGEIHLELDLPCALGSTKDEIQASVQGFIEDLKGAIPFIQNELEDAVYQVVAETLPKVAQDISSHISDRNLEHLQKLKRVHEDRVASVLRLWGEAIEQLDILRHMVLDWSSMALGQRQGTYAKPNTAFALHKLAQRAYEIVGEVIVLIRAGYADGALARWRSLHEVCVIAMFLTHRSDRCAEMYLAHHWVEELRLLEVDKGSGTAHSFNSHRDNYTRDLRAKVAALSSKFGAVFTGDYGWAATELACKRTTFRDLECQVGLETLRRGYRQANSTVHGGALATLTRISLGPGVADSADAPLAHGCEIAANYTTASLSMMVAELCLEAGDADLLVTSMVVHNQALKIREQIERVQKHLAGNSPRSRMLSRRAAQRESRLKKTGRKPRQQ